jgi:hypothetical protein
MRRELDLKVQTSGLHSGRRLLAEDSASPSGRSDTIESVSSAPRHNLSISAKRESAVSGEKEDRKKRGQESSVPKKLAAKSSLLMGCRYLIAPS